MFSLNQCILITGIIIAHVGLCNASVHKCIASNGHVKYQALPCDNQDIEAPVRAWINGDVAPIKYDTTHPNSPETRERTTPTRSNNEICAAAKTTLVYIKSGKYNNSAGSMKEKLRIRAEAIKQRMRHCK